MRLSLSLLLHVLTISKNSTGQRKLQGSFPLNTAVATAASGGGFPSILGETTWEKEAP